RPGSRGVRTRARPAVKASGRRLQRQEDRVVATTNEEEQVLALLDLLERGFVLVDVLDGRAIDLEDHVAAPNAGFVGGRARLDRAHHDALGLLDAEVLGDLGREGLDGEPEL